MYGRTIRRNFGLYVCENLPCSFSFFHPKQHKELARSIITAPPAAVTSHIHHIFLAAALANN